MQLSIYITGCAPMGMDLVISDLAFWLLLAGYIVYVLSAFQIVVDGNIY